MPGFRTHITGSTVVGIGLGIAGYTVFELSPAVSIIGGGLCAIGGILPDVDSDNGQSVREVMGFSAAVIPWLLMDHLRRAQLSHDQIVLAAGCLYVIIRFGIGEILRRYTVHRGMWHSIPAALIAGLGTSFICSCEEPTSRLFKVGGVVIGYLVHLILDEMYSIQWYRGRLRLKKSFGTALKFWGSDPWTNTAVFAKLVLLIYLTMNDPTLMAPSGHKHYLPDATTTNHSTPADPIGTSVVSPFNKEDHLMGDSRAVLPSDAFPHPRR